MGPIPDKLLPAFVAALALQHLAELISSFFDWRQGNADSGKKLLIGGVTTALACWAIDTYSSLGILSGLADKEIVPRTLDILLSGLVVSAGTDGFNSILKFALYKKDEAKSATPTEAPADADSAASLNLPQPQLT